MVSLLLDVLKVDALARDWLSSEALLTIDVARSPAGPFFSRADRSSALYRAKKDLWIFVFNAYGTAIVLFPIYITKRKRE